MDAPCFRSSLVVRSVDVLSWILRIGFGFMKSGRFKCAIYYIEQSAVSKTSRIRLRSCIPRNGCMQSFIADV